MELNAVHIHDFRGFDTSTNEEICLDCLTRRKCTHRKIIVGPLGNGPKLCILCSEVIQQRG